MIFYFSATGNSRHAAERAAAVTGERLVSIGAACRAGAYDYDLRGDRYLGFVLPTFAGTLPAPAADFIKNMALSGAEGLFVFGLFTCGESTGEEAQALSQALADRGIALSRCWDLVMPDNFIVWSSLPSPGALGKALTRADAALDEILAAVLRRESAAVPAGKPRLPFMPTLPAGENRLRVRAEACTGCGLCARLCPTGCLTLRDGLPQWADGCCTCLACLHRCPAAAIEHGQDTVGKRRYVYPGSPATL